MESLAGWLTSMNEVGCIFHPWDHDQIDSSIVGQVLSIYERFVLSRLLIFVPILHNWVEIRYFNSYTYSIELKMASTHSSDDSYRNYQDDRAAKYTVYITSNGVSRRHLNFESRQKMTLTASLRFPCHTPTRPNAWATTDHSSYKIST
jgi:hypothetical protein